MPNFFDQADDGGMAVAEPPVNAKNFFDQVDGVEEPVQSLAATAAYSFPKAFSNVATGTVGGIAKMADVGAEIVDKYTGIGKPEIFKTIGDVMDDASRNAAEMYPVDERNPLTATIAGGAAQGISLLAGGALGKAAGLGEAALTRIPLALGAAQGANQGIDTARELGVESPEARFALGALFGGTEVLTEKLGGIGNKAATDALVSQFRKPAGEMLKDAAKAVVIEGVEEIAAGSVQDWLARAFATEDPANPGFTKTGVPLPEVDPRTKEFLTKRGMEFLGGAAGGGVFAGAQVLANAGKPEAPPPSIESGESVVPEFDEAALEELAGIANEAEDADASVTADALRWTMVDAVVEPDLGTAPATEGDLLTDFNLAPTIRIAASAANADAPLTAQALVNATAVAAALQPQTPTPDETSQEKGQGQEDLLAQIPSEPAVVLPAAPTAAPAQEPSPPVAGAANIKHIENLFSLPAMSKISDQQKAEAESAIAALAGLNPGDLQFVRSGNSKVFRDKVTGDFIKIAAAPSEEALDALIAQVDAVNSVASKFAIAPQVEVIMRGDGGVFLMRQKPAGVEGASIKNRTKEDMALFKTLKDQNPLSTEAVRAFRVETDQSLKNMGLVLGEDGMVRAYAFDFDGFEQGTSQESISRESLMLKYLKEMDGVPLTSFSQATQEAIVNGNAKAQTRDYEPGNQDPKEIPPQTPEEQPSTEEKPSGDIRNLPQTFKPTPKQKWDWEVADDAGGTAFGNLKNGVADIIGMEASPTGKRYSEPEKYLRRGFFRQLVKTLQSQGAKTLKITMQSGDTRKALARLVETGELVNPRGVAGISVDEHPTTFDIPEPSKNVLTDASTPVTGGGMNTIEAIEREAAAIGEMQAKQKERASIYNAGGKEDAADLIGIKADRLYNLPYEKWSEVDKAVQAFRKEAQDAWTGSDKTLFSEIWKLYAQANPDKVAKVRNSVESILSAGGGMSTTTQENADIPSDKETRREIVDLVRKKHKRTDEDEARLIELGKSHPQYIRGIINIERVDGLGDTDMMTGASLDKGESRNDAKHSASDQRVLRAIKGVGMEATTTEEPDYADLHSYIEANHPKEASASRYLDPSAQYQFHLAVWKNAGSPKIDIEDAPSTPKPEQMTREAFTAKFGDPFTDEDKSTLVAAFRSPEYGIMAAREHAFLTALGYDAKKNPDSAGFWFHPDPKIGQGVESKNAPTQVEGGTFISLRALDAAKGDVYAAMQASMVTGGGMEATTPQRDATKPEQMTPDEFKTKSRQDLESVAAERDRMLAAARKEFEAKRDSLHKKNTAALKRISRLNPDGRNDGVDPSIDSAGKRIVESLLSEITTRKKELYDLQPPSQSKLFDEAAKKIGYQDGGHHRIDVIPQAITSNKPISAAAVEAYGIKLPSGYVKQGELYVFQPETPSQPPQAPAVQAAAQSGVDEARSEDGAVKRQEAGEPAVAKKPLSKRIISGLLARGHEVAPSGPANAGFRQEVLTAITGKRPPVAKAGVNAVEDALGAHYGISREGKTTAAYNDALREALMNDQSSNEAEKFIEGDEPQELSDFDITDWLNGERYAGVEPRPDTYHPGHISWGKDPAIGRRIQSARGKKQKDTNIKFFIENVFPKIQYRLNDEQLFSIAQATGSQEALQKSGYRLWRAGQKQQWIPPGSPLEAKAAEIGASVVEGATIDSKPEAASTKQPAPAPSAPSRESEAGAVATSPPGPSRPVVAAGGKETQKGGKATTSVDDAPEVGDEVTWNSGGKEAIGTIQRIQDGKAGIDYFGYKLVPLGELTLKRKSKNRINREKRESSKPSITTEKEPSIEDVLTKEEIASLKSGVAPKSWVDTTREGAASLTYTDPRGDNWNIKADYGTQTITIEGKRGKFSVKKQEPPASEKPSKPPDAKTPRTIAPGDSIKFKTEGKVHDGKFLGITKDGKGYSVAFSNGSKTTVSAHQINEHNGGAVVEGTAFSPIQETSPTETVVDKDIDSSLSDADKATAATELGFKSWNARTRSAFKKAYADWLVTAKAATTKLAEIFSKLAKATRALIIGGSIAISTQTTESHVVINDLPVRSVAAARAFPAKLTSFEMKMQAASLPPVAPIILPETGSTQPRIQATVRSKLDMRGTAAPASVTKTANWVVDTQDTKGRPFVIGDKTGGRVYVFDGSGKLVSSEAALFGMDRGDKNIEGKKITPSGRYDASIDPDANREYKYGKTLDFAERGDEVVAIHRVYLAIPSQDRPGRIESESPADNRVSGGCVNVTDKMFDEVIDPLFSSAGGIVYILPETKAGAKSFSPLFALPASRSSMPLDKARAHVFNKLRYSPRKVRVINEPSMEFRGRYDPDGTIVLNTAYLGSIEELNDVLHNHEAIHDAVETDEGVRKQADKLLGALTEDELTDIEADLFQYKDSGFSESDLQAERQVEAIRKLTANRPDLRSAWGRLVESVSLKLKRMFGGDVTRQQAELVAARIVARGLKRLRKGKTGGRIKGGSLYGVNPSDFFDDAVSDPRGNSDFNRTVFLPSDTKIPRASEISPQDVKALNAVWTSLEAKEWFTFGKTESRDAEDIASAFSTPDSPITATSDGSKVVFEASNGGRIVVEVNTSKGNAVLNILKNGPAAGQLYQAALTYLHNNDLEKNNLRLTERNAGIRLVSNMLSSALRHGTTKHLNGHGISGIIWRKGDDAWNIAQLARHEQLYVFGNLQPGEIKALLASAGLDGTGLVGTDAPAVEGARTGTLAEVLARPARYGIGPKTVARAAVTASILQGKDGAVRQAADRIAAVKPLYQASPSDVTRFKQLTASIPKKPTAEQLETWKQEHPAEYKDLEAMRERVLREMIPGAVLHSAEETQTTEARAKKNFESTIDFYRNQIKAMPSDAAIREKYEKDYAAFSKIAKNPDDPEVSEILQAIHDGIQPVSGGLEWRFRSKQIEIEAAEKEIAQAQGHLKRIVGDKPTGTKFETGKPVVTKVFHATPFGRFSSFDANKLGSFTGAPSAQVAHFFAGSRRVAESYLFDGSWKLPHKGFLRLTNQQRKELLNAISEEDIKSDQDIAAVADDLFGVDYDTSPAENTVYELSVGLKNPLVKDFKGEKYRDKSYRALLDEAVANGHDGVVMANTYDPGPAALIDDDAGTTNVIAVLAGNENQIKSSDPLLIDDSGNLITPEAWGDETSPDIRYGPDANIPGNNANEPSRGSSANTQGISPQDNSERANAIREAAAGIDRENSTRGEKAEAVANFARRTAELSYSRNPLPDWDILFTSDNSTRANAKFSGVSPRGVSIDFNTNPVAGMDLDGMDAEGSMAFAYDTMQEEMIHSLQYVVAHRQWVKAGKPGTYRGFVTRKAAAAINDAVGRQREAQRAGNTELAAKIKDALLASWNLYHGGKDAVSSVDELVLKLNSRAVNPPQYFAELTRQMAQLTRQDFTTETGWLKFKNMVLGWFQDAINSLKAALPLARGGQLGPIIQQEISELESLMKNFENGTPKPLYSLVPNLNQRQNEPVTGKEKRGQAFGQPEIAQIHQRQSTAVAYQAAQAVFNSAETPVTPESRTTFLELMRTLLDPRLGPSLAQDLIEAGNDMAPVALQDEMATFALRAAAEGDVSLLNMFLNNENRMSTGTDSNVSKSARELAMRRWAEATQLLGGLDGIKEERDKAAIKSGVKTAEMQALQDELNAAKVKIEELLKALESKKAKGSGKNGVEVVDAVGGKRKKPAKAKAKKDADEAEKSLEEITAQSISDQIANRLSDPEVSAPFVNQKEKVINVVRELAKTYKGGSEEALMRQRLAELPIPAELQDELVKTLNANLEANKVIRSDAQPTQTAQAIVDAHVKKFMPNTTAPQENRTKTRIEQALRMTAPTVTRQQVYDTLKKNLTELQIAEPLADSVAKITADAWQIRRSAAIEEAVEKVSAKWLLQQILKADVNMQQSPNWRQDMMAQWLSLSGFTAREVELAVKVLDKPFGKALADARLDAAERYAEQMRKVLGVNVNGRARLKKAVIPAIERVQNALRTGSFEGVSTEMAKWQGWKPLSAAELKRLNELDAQIKSSPSRPYPGATPPHYVLKATHEMFDIFKKHVSGSTLENMAIAFHLNLLSGLPTAGINIIGPPMKILGDSIIDIARAGATLDIGRFQSIASALKTAASTYFKEGRFTAKYDISDRYGVTEITTTREIANLNYQLDKWLAGLKQAVKDRSPTGILKGVFGISDIVRRFLTVADTAGTAAVNAYSLIMGAHQMAKDAGVSTRNIRSLFTEARMEGQRAYGDAVMAGYSPEDAGTAAIDAQRAAILGGVYDFASPEKAFLLDRMSKQEGFLAIGRKPVADDLNEDFKGNEITDRLGENLEGGLISRHLFGVAGMNDVLEAISAFKYGGNTPKAKALRTVLGTLMYGLVHVPYRASRHFAAYSPYGFIRYGVKKLRDHQGKENWYMQSMGTPEQEQTALWRAAAGTALMALIASLFRGSDEPEEKDKDYITVTGNGPPTDDPQVRDAWIKQGNQPYHMKGRLFGVPFNVNIGRGGEVALFAALPFAVADDLALRDKIRGYKSKDYKASDIVDAFSTYVAALSTKGGIGGLIDLSGKHTSTLASGKGIASAVSGYAANVIPLNRFIQTTENLFITPPDKSTVETTITANIPLARLGNFPALNRMGDPVGDASWLGKISYLGVPLPIDVEPTAENKKVYEVIHSKMAAPGRMNRVDVEKKYGELTNRQWYDFVKASGGYLSKRITDSHDKLMKMNAGEVDKWMAEVDETARARAANGLGLRVVKVSTVSR